MLEEVGLLVSERHGKWTYYRRNESAFQELSQLIEEEL
jgi:ArsR family transcriptional regulator